MAPTLIGILGLFFLLILIFIRVPVGVALGIVAAFGISILLGIHPAISIFGSESYNFLNNWTLTAIPMFIFMGELAHQTGFTERLYQVARILFGRLPGGLAIATNVASAGFAAASGSSMAMAGAMSRLAIPEMLKARYDKGLAAGSVASSGTLGALIPPSIPFILYGAFMEVSIGKLLLAGLIPGLLTLFAYSTQILIRCIRNPLLAPPPDNVDATPNKWRLIAHAWPLGLVIIVIIGGLYSGLVSATEVGAFGAFTVIGVSLIDRSFSFNVILSSALAAVKMTATIFLIAVGAVLFSKFIILSQLPTFLGTWIELHSLSLAYFMFFVCIFYLIGGMFLDPIGLMLVTLPVLSPMLSALHVDLIWFGVIVVKLIEIGMLTPPVGLNLFVTSAAVGDKIPFETIVKGTAWFLIAEIFVMLILLFFPTLSLFIPQHM